MSGPDVSLASSVIELMLLVGLFVYPVLFLLRLVSQRKVVTIRKFLRFLKGATLAVNYNNQLISRYQTVAFVPSVVGASGSVLANFYSSLGISQEVTLRFLVSYLALLVISGVGIGLLAAGVDRALPAFLAELILGWAVIGGSLLFLAELVILYQAILPAAVAIMIFLIAIYLISFTYYVVENSVSTYIKGATAWVP